MSYKYTEIVLKSMGIRIVQRATPMLVDRLNVGDSLDLSNFVGEEDLAVIVGVGTLGGGSKTLVATLVGAA
jgi:hypothetical protein